MSSIESNGTAFVYGGPEEFGKGELVRTSCCETGIILGTRQYETGNWTRRPALSSPSPRTFSAMAFDDRSSVIVLFGGQGPNGFLNDTWTYDLASGVWKRMIPPELYPAPSPRAGHSMAYDRVNDVMVLFGGQKNDGGVGESYNDTWTYNLSANRWVQKYPAAFPSPRHDYGFSYAGAEGELVLFGGSAWESNRQYLLGDTWVYDVTENLWANISPATAPFARAAPAMAFHEDSGRVVLFSGHHLQTGIITATQDTWVYEHGKRDWTRMNPARFPDIRTRAAMVFDHRIGEVVLFGGTDAGSVRYGDTWSYNPGNDTWTARLAPVHPSERISGGMAYDRVHDAAIIFGGLNSSIWTIGDVNRYSLNDTWAYRFDGFETSGTYTSVPLDTGGKAYFGALGLNATIPAGTSTGLQFRAAATALELGGLPFTGPDGTPGTNYTASGQPLFAGLNGSRWVQYRASLGTSDILRTPVLHNVSFVYNLMHSASITFPTGGEKLGGVQEIRWQASDPDNDTLAFDLYLHRGLSRFPLALNLSNGTRSYSWNTSLNESGTYRIRLVARDVGSPVPLQSEDLSFNFTVDNPPPPPPNNPPWVELLGPQDGLFIRETGVTLEWQGYDNDGDALMYRVFASDSPFGADTLPAPRTTTSQRSFWLSGLAQGTTYYWTVVASDGKDNGTVPEVRRFTILAPPSVNNPPAVALLSPPDGSVLNATSVVLAWDAADPDGDNLTFSVFFGPERFDAARLPAAAASQTNLSCAFHGLANGTSYWWTVTASDGKAQSAVPAVRKLTIDVTRGNHPPRFASEPPLSARAGSPYEYAPAAIDDDGDNLTFSLSVRPDGMTVSPLTGNISWNPRPKHAGGNPVVLRVMDSRGGLAEQRFVVDVGVTLPVCMITFPRDNATLRADTVVKGTAVKGLADLWRVEVRIDGGPWAAASGTGNWSYPVRIAGLPPGAHRLEARAVEPEMASDIAAIGFNVGAAGTGPAEGGVPWVPLGLIIVLGAASAALFARGLLRRKP